MAKGRSTKIIQMIKWIRTSRLSIKSCLSRAGAVSPAELYVMPLQGVFGVPDEDGQSYGAA